jgi:hypothetical protein
MSRIYISDTNIWIDFNNAGLLDELFQLPFTFCCTEFVLDELNNFDHSALLARGLLVEPLDDTAVIKLYGLMANTTTAHWQMSPAISWLTRQHGR